MAQHLFSPITFREIEIRNRIGLPPMCQYCAVDGTVNAWHLVHYGSRASGGVGLIIMEATAVVPEGRITPLDLGIWSDDHVEPLGQLADFVNSQGAVLGLQIAHAGRKASTSSPNTGNKPLTDGEGGWTPVAPSPVVWKEGYREPTELSLEEIKEIQLAFGEAAYRADLAEIKFLELHAAHGYLIHSFLSPLTNLREDNYGGNFENRTRFLLETVEEIRTKWPKSKPLSVRLSCRDWIKEGWTLAESVELASKLKWAEVDIINCSSGGIVPEAKPSTGSSWQVPLSEKIRSQTGIATATAGMIIEPMQADAIIRNKQADIVLLGRQLLREPFWPFRAARKLEKRHLLQVPEQYRLAMPG